MSLVNQSDFSIERGNFRGIRTTIRYNQEERSVVMNYKNTSKLVGISENGGRFNKRLVINIDGTPLESLCHPDSLEMVFEEIRKK